MEDCKPIINTGLRDVVIASTKISDVMGDVGKLIYRGYPVKDLAENATFEEVAHLLLYEKLPDNNELAEFKSCLSAERHIPAELITALKTSPGDALPMDILQAGVSMLAHHDPDVKDPSREASLRMGIKLIAKMPSILAAWDRIRNNKAPLEPSPDLDHAGNFLYMLTGTMPDDEISRFFDVCLILHAEHSFNASTFAAREVASTRAHMYAAVAAAVGSLSGALHGGANTRVMNMLLKIGSPDAVEKYINHELEAGRKIMGLGHAVYKVDDPRALILAPMSETMGKRTNDTRWYEISAILEQKAKQAFKKHKNMDIFVNVDFYSASLYYYMGIPVDLFTPVFAISRISGWAAHVLEEQFAEAAPKPMLYRPESEYIGDYCGPDECLFTPIEER
ncbi:citrate/2-methylcitrate synthase [Desulfonema magnum]|uniref:Citrate synthase n=1 Tax=Desulfonema magnum TaxID=45655 RepID=A0A975GQ67_9BACT|nr:citrate/2-methylcitrate synthase [Desulfonema magnum]QTA89580.1 Citrate synthase [Desulfonema magnum]